MARMRPLPLLTRITRPASLGETPPSRRDRLVLANQIAVLLVPVAVLGGAGNAVSGDRAMATGLGLLILVAFGTPGLCAAGRFTAARALLVLGSPVLLLGPGMLGASFQVANLAALPYAVLTMSLLPTLVFDPDAERRLRGSCNLALLVVLLGHDHLLAHIAGQPGPAADTKMAQAALWLAALASLRFLEDRDPGERER